MRAGNRGGEPGTIWRRRADTIEIHITMKAMHYRSFLCLFMVIAAALWFAPTRVAAAPAGAEAPIHAVSPTTAAPATSPTPMDQYTLGPDDKVKITVFGEESLSGEFLVSGNGNISYPLIGDVHAAGLTVGQLVDELKQKLRKGYLRNPDVSAEVTTFRPFYILGEVMRPGQYPYSNGMTVLSAVATAGGFTYRAKTGEVYIKHANQSKEQEYDVTDDLKILPGDTIRVKERWF
jgi:polysaccharide export outer membrane protein